jgi:hypothetical protein
VVGECLVDVGNAIHNGKANVFIGPDDKEVGGFLEHLKQAVLVRDKVGWASQGWFEETEDVGPELLHVDLEFSLDGVKGGYQSEQTKSLAGGSSHPEK